MKLWNINIISYVAKDCNNYQKYYISHPYHTDHHLKHIARPNTRTHTRTSV